MDADAKIARSEKIYQTALNAQMEAIRMLPEPQRSEFLRRATLMNDHTTLLRNSFVQYRSTCEKQEMIIEKLEMTIQLSDETAGYGPC
jgi:hypothetical protein